MENVSEKMCRLLESREPNLSNKFTYIFLKKTEIFGTIFYDKDHEKLTLILPKRTRFLKILFCSFDLGNHIAFEFAQSRIHKLREGSKYKKSFFIDALIAPNRAADMQANLDEAFPLWVERHGLGAANRIRKVQIARLIIGEYWNKAIELIKAVKLAGS